MRHYNIPIFVPHLGCPFDCVFCNQRHITGTNNEITAAVVTDTVCSFLSTLPKGEKYVEIGFFGGSFTGIETTLQKELLGAAYEFVKRGEVDGVRLSTRPDYITDDILKRLIKYGVTAIELGVQSMDDGVLIASGRGHTSSDVLRAVECISRYDVKLGLQMMTGLPGDTKQKSMQTAEKIIELKPDHVRIYPTLVIADTQLENLYKNSEYMPQTVDDAVDLCKELLCLFEASNIKVIRMSLAVTDEISPGGSLVAGPFHPAFREKVEAAVYFDKISREIEKDTAVVYVNDREVSKAIGNGRENIKKWEMQGVKVQIIGNENITKGEIKLEK